MAQDQRMEASRRTTRGPEASLLDGCLFGGSGEVFIAMLRGYEEESMAEEWRKLLDLSLEELETEIGKQLAIEELGALPPSLAGLRERGERWARANVGKLKAVVCGNETVRDLAAQGFSAELVNAVLGLVETIVLRTAVAPLAVLLCRRGLQVMCAEEWK
jgi:hypothetical protein